jgi:ribonuclease E
MTDETTTRTRRRVRSSGQTDTNGNQDKDRRRTRTRPTDDSTSPSTTASDDSGMSPGVRRRRVRKREVNRTTDADAARVTSGESTRADNDGGTERGEAGTTTRKRTPKKADGKPEDKPGGKTSRSKSADGGRAKSEGRSRSDGDRKKASSDDDGSDLSKSSGDGAGDARSRKSKGRKNRRKTGGASPRGGVSEETRRSITEGPPRRMLVSVGSERTEVAVLEERDLVEHYVTRKETESYVGNVYLGRVQNVLPGMEAAFVDIGKGRNGVLYAGEVNYDDDDVESKAPRIEQALKPGQTVVVQVTKDPMGTKGARLTQQLSLAGRYCVLAVEDGTVGISRKLTDSERDRLRETLKEIKPDGYGLIVRTAAAGATREQLEADVKRLVHRWEQVQQRLETAKPLTEVYREPDLAMRVIRDVFGSEYRELICDDRELYEQIQEYLHDVSPDLASTVTLYDGDQSLFDAYEITNQVRRALEKKVWLASGGYLIIEKTEAMWVIDVNTGKFVGDSNLEETVLKNNLEAADEIARQLRLRDMGGIIVIDFVDMLLPVNRDEVLKRFKRELARDKTKSRVMEISKLGLVQMTRKNVSQGLTETFTKTCECCEGRGAQIVDKSLQR